MVARRRSWIPGLLLAIQCAAALASPTQVAPGVHAVIGVTTAGAQPDGNSIILEAPEGLVVIDTGRHAAHTQQILDFAQAKGKPIVAVINSHWHLDHVGGNVMLRARYPQLKVYASAAIREAQTGFLANYRKDLEAALAKTDAGSPNALTLRTELALLKAGPALEPTDLISKSGPREIGGRHLHLHLERGSVTAGDIWIFDPQSGVLVAGDLVTLPAPFLDTACPSRWRNVLADLTRQPFRVLIPGHGVSMQPAQLKAYHESFDNLLACSADHSRPKQDCIDGWMRDAAPLIPEHDRQYAQQLLSYYLDNVLRGNTAKVNEACRA